MAVQCEWHAVRWLDQAGRFGVVKLDQAGRWLAQRGPTGEPRRLLAAQAAQRAALGRPPFGVVPVSVSFVAVSS